MDRPNWFEVVGVQGFPSPSLLLFRERIEANLAEMVRIAGNPTRLCPHLKTHKLPQLVRRQMELGMRRFKAATLVEARMAADAGADSVLMAYPPVGPAIRGFVDLVRGFHGTRFACVADSRDALLELSIAASAAGIEVDVLLDLDLGQHRTGIVPDDDACELYAWMARLPGIRAGGLHAYDGHVGDPDWDTRVRQCDEAFEPVQKLWQQLAASGFPVSRVVAGGSPTFPIHARRAGVELSPGTTVFWDAGYAHKFPDLQFLPAAVLVGRVISKPSSGRLCLDLGHKAVASEMPQPRLQFLNLPNAKPVFHSEEHLVVETPETATRRVGEVVYALPWHVCPTVALHDEVIVVAEGRPVDRWRVEARTRVMSRDSLR